MPQIALFTAHNVYDSLDNQYDSVGRDLLTKQITDWVEVTAEELELLRRYSHYKIVQRLTQEEVKLELSAVIKSCQARKMADEKRNEKYIAEQNKREEKALKRKLDKAKKLLQENNVI